MEFFVKSFFVKESKKILEYENQFRFFFHFVLLYVLGFPYYKKMAHFEAFAFTK